MRCLLCGRAVAPFLNILPQMDLVELIAVLRRDADPISRFA
jgi:hypothetical protein